MGCVLGKSSSQFLFVNDRAHSRMLSNANATSIRLLNYPPLTGDEGDIRKSVTRCGVHTDYGGMTLLFQVIAQYSKCIDTCMH